MNDGGFINRGVGTVEQTPEELNAYLEGKVSYSDFPIKMVSTSVDANVGTKQALLAAVPTGKKRIITLLSIHTPTGDWSETRGAINFGYVADLSGPGMWSINDPSILTTDAANLLDLRSENASLQTDYGLDGEVFGVLFNAPRVAGTMIVDVFYYDINA